MSTEDLPYDVNSPEAKAVLLGDEIAKNWADTMKKNPQKAAVGAQKDFEQIEDLDLRKIAIENSKTKSTKLWVELCDLWSAQTDFHKDPSFDKAAIAVSKVFDAWDVQPQVFSPREVESQIVDLAVIAQGFLFKNSTLPPESAASKRVMASLFAGAANRLNKSFSIQAKEFAKRGPVARGFSRHKEANALEELNALNASLLYRRDKHLYLAEKRIKSARTYAQSLFYAASHEVAGITMENAQMALSHATDGSKDSSSVDMRAAWFEGAAAGIVHKLPGLSADYAHKGADLRYQKEVREVAEKNPKRSSTVFNYEIAQNKVVTMIRAINEGVFMGKGVLKEVEEVVSNLNDSNTKEDISMILGRAAQIVKDPKLEAAFSLKCTALEYEKAQNRSTAFNHIKALLRANKALLRANKFNVSAKRTANDMHYKIKNFVCQAAKKTDVAKATLYGMARGQATPNSDLYKLLDYSFKNAQYQENIENTSAGVRLFVSAVNAYKLIRYENQFFNLTDLANDIEAKSCKSAADKTHLWRAVAYHSPKGSSLNRLAKSNFSIANLEENKEMIAELATEKPMGGVPEADWVGYRADLVNAATLYGSLSGKPDARIVEKETLEDALKDYPAPKQRAALYFGAMSGANSLIRKTGYAQRGVRAWLSGLLGNQSKVDVQAAELNRMARHAAAKAEKLAKEAELDQK